MLALPVSTQGTPVSLPRGSGAWWICLACRHEHSRPCHLVSTAAREALTTFADRSMDSIERIGRLALKHHRCENGAFVNEVEKRVDRRRTPIERQLKGRGIHEAGLRERLSTLHRVTETEDRWSRR